LSLVPTARDSESEVLEPKIITPLNKIFPFYCYENNKRVSLEYGRKAERLQSENAANSFE
jgi:hypothetical protein